MDDDDRQVGRILSRRQFLALFGPAGATAATTAPNAAAAQIPACVVRPALTEGPYFVDEKLNRSDIRSDPTSNTVKEGAPFELTIRVSQLNGSACTPLQGA